MQKVNRLWKSGIRGKLLIGCGGLLILFFACLLVVIAIPSPKTAPQATSTTAPVVAKTDAVVSIPTKDAPTASPPKMTDAPVATNTVRPTEAPRPTNTPRPTDMPRPTITPRPSPTANVGTIGERRETGGIALTIAKVSKLNQIGDLWRPQEGNIYLAIEVVIENVTRDEAPYNPLYFKVKDSDGFEYTSALVAPSPDLKSGTLTKGDKVRGNVAFEVKATAKGFVVSYEPLVILGGYQPIRVDLGQ